MKTLCLNESWVSCKITKESGSVTPKILIPKEKEPVGSEVKAYKSGAKLVVCMLEASCGSDVLLSPLWCPGASTPQVGRMNWSLEQVGASGSWSVRERELVRKKPSPGTLRKQLS